MPAAADLFLGERAAWTGAIGGEVRATPGIMGVIEGWAVSLF
jgi:hypothetical protein